MQYRFVSVLAAGVLVGVTSAAPVPSAEVRHHRLVTTPLRLLTYPRRKRSAMIQQTPSG